MDDLQIMKMLSAATYFPHSFSSSVRLSCAVTGASGWVLGIAFSFRGWCR